jgi:hypothetical protein
MDEAPDVRLDLEIPPEAQPAVRAASDPMGSQHAVDKEIHRQFALQPDAHATARLIVDKTWLRGCGLGAGFSPL